MFSSCSVGNHTTTAAVSSHHLCDHFALNLRLHRRRSHPHVDAAVARMWPLLFAALCAGLQASTLEPSIPNRVLTVVGSCALIPCSFTSPSTSGSKRSEVDVRLRLRGRRRLSFFPTSCVAFNSEEAEDIDDDFQGRVSLSGSVTDGDCSMKMEGISMEDAKTYEVALKGTGESNWGRAKSFSLDVVDTPDAPVISGVSSAAEGQVVTFNCSVRFQCPTGPPTLRWKWERGVHPVGDQEVRTLYEQDRQLLLQSSFTFRVTRQVKAGLRCELSYPTANLVAAVKDLRVTFPPKEVKVQVQTLTVQEGGSVLLACSCKADPPVSEYHWSYRQHGHTVHLQQRTHSIRLYNVTRDMAVHCMAENSVGRAQSRATVLNVQYKPVIERHLSICMMNDGELSCVCSARSNPRPAISWSVNGTTLPRGYNASLSADALTATLRGRTDGGEQTVTCSARNVLGNDSMILFQRQGEGDFWLLPWLLIPAITVILFTISLTVIVIICCCRKKSSKRMLSERLAGVGPCQTRMPVYINCSEVSHVYTNGSYQLLYQNCTPRFVRNKQARRMGRRGGERRRGGPPGAVDTHIPPREERGAPAADPESAIYLEIL
ncbi:sialoadhesin isoform X1 [Corythoichthys intestinalis]|uniref:sialoadhesin isoform X1 n=1 Tax=Corythoichthys intestinalis TaxID=161448 RepID=UPI0025A66771|nr:sialoadhesin isoform X1 [Corythoichthys intestinalis]